jgi:ABC-type lipoprotein export system ATPase subunit
MDSSSVYFRGRQPSIVESFKIEDLYGYRTISVDSQYAATIVIAKNGSGKTTLLAALDAFLRGQFSRLQDIKFYRIVCKLRGSDDDLILTRDEVIEYITIRPGSVLEQEARRIAKSPTELFRFLEGYGPINSELSDEIYSSIARRFGYGRADAAAFCDNLRASLMDQSPNIGSIISILKNLLKDTEIVYLPTYRRLELSLTSDETDPRQKPQPAPFKMNRYSLHSGEIRFGLSDIPERLTELNHRILTESNRGYREISAKIITDLLDGSFDRRTDQAGDEPTKDELDLFFSRLQEGRRIGPRYLDAPPNLQKLFSDRSLSNESNAFLSFFLRQLNVVIGATRDVERLVQTFVDRCNSYLSSVDESVEVGPPMKLVPGADNKELKLSRSDLSVYLESKTIRRRIPLNSLSSGEKQMISLLGKLYLYPNDKIILIDEPELSLSMDWQRKILVDIMNAPLCKQMVAIAHSPFVFENDLDPFAKSLSMSIDLEGLSDFSDSAGDDAHE